MPSKNKFGFESLETKAVMPRPERSVGPMGAAVREAAESLQETTEAKVEQRRRNAEDAREFRAAQADGRVLETLPLTAILTTDLPRDRIALEAVARSDEMEELKASIRERGQKEPIEVYLDGDGAYQLKKGWRRFTALSQLLAETGDTAFATIISRIEATPASRMSRYIDMVEENVVREDLTFAEMAQVAITAAADEGVEEPDPAELVSRLYASLHKMKRSYIRSFVFLMSALEGDLKWPKAVSRNLGVDVARVLKNQDQADALRAALAGCVTPEDQNALLMSFVAEAGAKPAKKTKIEPRQKFEFHVGKVKVTARQGECRIVSDTDYTGVPREALERAIRAFEEELGQGGPRVTNL